MTGWRAGSMALLLLAGTHAARADCRADRPADAAATAPVPRTVSELDAADYLHFSILKRKSVNTVLLWGEICVGDAERVRAALDAYRPIEEVLLISGGGSLADGLTIGRIIRRNKITTRIRAGDVCFSACNFMFMGGTVRYIEPGGKFGVHMFTTAGFSKDDVDAMETIRNADRQVETYNAAHPDAKRAAEDVMAEAMGKYIRSIQQDAAETAAEIARFLVDMQLSLRFLTAFASIPNDSPRFLSRDELRDFNIVNSD